MAVTAAKTAHFVRCFIAAQFRHAPLFLRLIPTDHCLLNCKYCYQHRAARTGMPAGLAASILDHAARLGTAVVSLLGGEPLLWPHVEEIVARATRLGLLTDITSNGCQLTAERLQALKKAGLDYLNVSVDSLTPDEISQKNRLADPSFAALLTEARAAGIRVRINAVLYNDNRAGIMEVIDCCCRLRLPLSIGFVTPDPDSDGNGPWLLTNMDAGLRDAWIDEVLRRRRAGCRIIDPPAYFMGLPRYLRHESFWRCNYPRRLGWINVDPTGHLRSCTKHMGDVGPLFTDLTPQRLAAFRLALREKVAGCNRFCYSNCAFDGAYFRRHPMAFLRTFLAA